MENTEHRVALEGSHTVQACAPVQLCVPTQSSRVTLQVFIIDCFKF
jgi:hypothetical protein